MSAHDWKRTSDTISRCRVCGALQRVRTPTSASGHRSSRWEYLAPGSARWLPYDPPCRAQAGAPPAEHLYAGAPS